jgi:hypothetical protein
VTRALPSDSSICTGKHSHGAISGALLVRCVDYAVPAAGEHAEPHSCCSAENWTISSSSWQQLRCYGPARRCPAALLHTLHPVPLKSMMCMLAGACPVPARPAGPQQGARRRHGGGSQRRRGRAGPRRAQGSSYPGPAPLRAVRRGEGSVQQHDNRRAVRGRALGCGLPFWSFVPAQDSRPVVSGCCTTALRCSLLQVSTPAAGRHATRPGSWVGHSR